MFLNKTCKVGLIKSEIYTKYTSGQNLSEPQSMKFREDLSSCFGKISSRSLCGTLSSFSSFSSSGFGIILLRSRFLGSAGFFGLAGLVGLGIIILLSLWLKGILVGDGNAHEVGVDGTDNSGKED